MNDGYLISCRDYDRLQRLLRMFDAGELNKPQTYRRRGGATGGGTKIRKAYAKADAGTGSEIVCYLDIDAIDPEEEEEEEEEETVEEITVTCEIVGGSNLNAAVPRLKDGTMITVWNDAGTWRSINTFQASTDC